MYKQYNFILLCVFLLGVAPVALAQSIIGQEDAVRFVVTPEIPGPQERVSIQIEGVGPFLGEATISWSLDGKVIKSGVAENSFTFTTGGLGVQSRVHIVIVSATKGTIVRDMTFLPTTVNLVWEADTSVPALYKGKALYSAGSDLVVTAFPQVVVGGVSASIASLSYQWKLNNQAVPAQSGRGKNRFAFAGDQLKNIEAVSVDVYSGSALVARGSVTIPAQEPQLLLYNRDPLRGVLYDAVIPSRISLSAKEITVRAEPYFFANRSSRALTFDWTLNNQTITGPDSRNGILTLRQSGTGKGEGVLRVSLQNTDSSAFVQAAQKALTVVFGVNTQNSSNLFGL